jgi:hypothetical protein
MATVIAGMATSLDSFVADESGGARLYPDLEELHGTGYMEACRLVDRSTLPRRTSDAQRDLFDERLT